MLARKFLTVLALTAVLVGSVTARGKKPLDHDVYDGWRSIRSSALSRSGNWAIFTIAPQVGDGEMIVRSTTTEREFTIPRGSGPTVSHDEKYVVFAVAPTRQETETARRERKPLPRNSMGILNLDSGEVATVENVETFRMGTRGGGWVFYRPAGPAAAPVAPAAPARTPTLGRPPRTNVPGASPTPAAPSPDLGWDAETDQEQPAAEGGSSAPAKKRNHAAGNTWVARELETGREFKIDHVADLVVSEDGSVVLLAISTPDGAGDGLFYREDPAGESKPILVGLGRYTQIAWHRETRQVAFLTDRDDYAADTPALTLYLGRLGQSPTAVASNKIGGLPEGWVVSNRGSVRFSRSGERLIFSAAPLAPPEPTDSTPADERVTVDVWHWRDPVLQPQQLRQVSAERNRTFQFIRHRDGRVVQIETPELKSVAFSTAVDGRFGVARNDEPYKIEESWGRSHADIHLVDLRTGESTLVHRRFPASAAISEGGRFLYWFEPIVRHWFARDLETGVTRNITERIPTNLYNEDFDNPTEPPAFGLGGWVEADRYVLVYDEFDVWRVDPTGAEPPFNVTDGVGQLRSWRFRVVRAPRETPGLPLDEPLLLSKLDLRRMDSGFYRESLVARTLPERLIVAAARLDIAAHSAESDRLLVTCQRFDEAPNLWLTNTSFVEPKRISDVNPQQKDYNWGTADLVRWVSANGRWHLGLLIKPEDFDAAKKYPMIVYFYERSSESLHRYISPAPSASTINPTMYASNGYLVFIPDVHYREGYPGESAEHAILSGTARIVERGYVDPKAIGIQGQSWGGYQVVHIISRTDMFAAACSGAAVSNMFSAYNAIRWGSGRVRQFQYEIGQSRIGASMWERPLQFIENSPIFWADRIQTPLLMMHNDQDGAVPWEQGIELFTALRRLQRPVWMINYNGEDHNLVQRRNRKDWSIRMQQFFDHFLKGAPAPVWLTEGVPAVRKGRTLGLEIPGAPPTPSRSAEDPNL